MAAKVVLLTFLSLIFAFPPLAMAEKFKYNELQIKDYDEMLTLVRFRTKKAQKLMRSSQSFDDDEDSPISPEALDLYRSAFQLILSRPNQDNMLGKLLPDIRKELVNLNAFEDTLGSLVSEALTAFQVDRLPVVYKSTYFFILENVLAEFRSEVGTKDDLRRIFEKIAQAKIEIPKEVRRDLQLRSMLTVESPSDRAKKILSDVADIEAKAAAKSKADASSQKK